MASFILFDEYSNNSWFENIYRKDDKKYIGSFYIDSFNKTYFIIEPKVFFKRSPFYRVKGEIRNYEKDNYVGITMTLTQSDLFGLVLLVLFVLFGLVFVFFDRLVNFTNVDFLKSQWIFVIPLILFVITNLVFQYSSNFFITDFKENFEESLEVIREV